MKKSVLIILTALLLLMYGCGDNQIQASAIYELEDTVDVDKNINENSPSETIKETKEEVKEIEKEELIEEQETEKDNKEPEIEEETTEELSAEEMIDSLQDSMKVKQESKTGTFYGDTKVTGTGKDALKEKTKALFEKEFFDLNVKADTQTGARNYYLTGDE